LRALIPGIRALRRARAVGSIILAVVVTTMTGPGVVSRPTALFPPQTTEVAWFRLRAAASLVVAAQADQRCDPVHADGFEQATLAR
jgi:hypothetical protein